MSTEQPQGPTPPAPPERPAGEKSIEELEREAQRTREELGQTVDALSEKADVRRQARQKVDDLKGRVSASAGEDRTEQAARMAGEAQRVARRQPLAVAGGALVLGFVLGRVSKGE